MTEQFDVFLCHNSKDKPLVETIADQLRLRGLNPWLDKASLAGGDQFTIEIEKAIVNSKSAVIFFGNNGVGNWQKREIGVCYSRSVDASKEGLVFKVIPVLLPGVTEVPKDQMFLREIHRISFLDLKHKDAFKQLESAIRSKEPQSTNVSSSSTFYVPKSSISSISSSSQTRTEILPGGITLEMIKIPAGSFLMGSAGNSLMASVSGFLRGIDDYDERGLTPDEKPQHQVNLQEFYLGKYPVTQEQYQAVMGNNPSRFKGFFKNNPKNPVENVTWSDAQEFCQKLNEQTGKNYRLPSEAEWEYACRAGTQTRYYFGDSDYQLGKYAWYRENSDSKTHPVGQRKPNNWGLCDMYGNVGEWCEDDYHENYQNAPKDGSSWNDDYSQSSQRVVRGGSYFDAPKDCRSADRNRDNAVYRHDVIGFRLALGPF
jgi:formylglycine-generating enzyme required for sulfatase activity